MEQVLKELTSKDDLLDLLLVNRGDLVSEVEIGDCLDYSNHEEIEFKSVDRRKSASKTSTLDMRRADLRLFRELISKVPLENVFAGMMYQGGLRVLRWITMCRGFADQHPSGLKIVFPGGFPK
ncbi:hypothetical protein BTVI_58202 [Pitangus sulphuratus]|nr:hypothetical protein BTVI_58202 [Pitangus sulphuratus]